jgi:yecA family protein
MMADITHRNPLAWNSLERWVPVSKLPLTDEELDVLGDFLDDVEGPQDRLALSAFDGFVAALGVAHEQLQPSEWLELVLGTSEDDVDDEIVELLVRHAGNVREQLQAGDEDFLPIFDLFTGEDDQEQVSPIQWCAGFLLATDAFPNVFAKIDHDDEAVNLMLPIVVFGTEEGLDALDENDEEGFAESLMDAIQPSVLALVKYFSD